MPSASFMYASTVAADIDVGVNKPKIIRLPNDNSEYIVDGDSEGVVEPAAYD